ncbi:hypothetical protein AAZX31_19G082700 [Glycine max]|uniref:Uncharacterized protein n=4 Tax=Glycine subgen. Soja TaxID=1462606 RepID=K7MXG1_SOYBN|nr:uncharacterized protein LOC100797780 isoform X2 [Glycine max]XP_028218697.1 uncharacterized protein LOC114400448 isoform X2 [Glycine soja]KRG94542.1 hypothetical protein GLYMA_19G092300v4 [Glycine max]RZB47140.1 hypothetical protein D0Y65_050962 [Glycine soja]|eukprot:XP_006604150.1 uncharacterized protein LOC100797780 isoform X2 [Glycine max]
MCFFFFFVCAMDRQENLLPSSMPSQLLSIDKELWQMAEERAQEILWTIQPNVLSEVNRKDVIDYVQRLIRGYYGAEVLPFGSVPLKTYLPDGDIDLTALSHEDAEEDLAQAVCYVLQSGDDPEYQVKDIKYIRAQVRLVKCTVKNIAVDISFNQMAGICTLRFLEQVDQLVGKNHIFKRSIILIKAWCYYESRLLGGHHGLLSTYAVEILVLYIINRFHSSVRGPLEVLYIFLDYYGSFDWDHNYVSIWGPKPLSSFPEIAETLECDHGEFLLQKEFLRNYRNMCSFPSRATKTMTHEFPVKFMNILDPLRNDNNLGRSVNIASLHRFRFALSYGARRLKQILTLPGETMGAALEKFFFSTLDRNGKGERADVDVPVSPFGIGRSIESVLCGDCESYFGGLQYVQLYRNYALPVTVHSSSPSSPSQDDILASSTHQNWSMFYQGGTDVYIPAQTLYHPTYSLEGRGKSRGTGTYIPDLNYNSYWDMRTKPSRPRRFASSKYNALPKSPPKKLQAEEVHSETDINAISDSRLFELSSEDFPLLPCNCKDIPPTQAQDSTPLAKFHSETDMDVTSQLFEFSNEDFPLLPKICSETHMEGSSRSFELSKKDFPLLQSICKTVLSESAKLTKQAKSFPSSKESKLKNTEFGSFRNHNN